MHHLPPQSKAKGVFCEPPLLHCPHQSPGRSFPVRPGLLAEHLVALQAGLVGLTEGVARSPHTDILHEAQVTHLMAHQGLREDVGGLLIVGLDTPEKKKKYSVIPNTSALPNSKRQKMDVKLRSISHQLKRHSDKNVFFLFIFFLHSS